MSTDTEPWDFRWQRGTAARWTMRNIVLGPGEPGMESDTGKFKLGNGSTPWNDLPYFLDEEGIVVLVESIIADTGGLDGDPRIGSMNDLTTEDTSLIVNAINEINSEGADFVLLYENAKAG